MNKEKQKREEDIEWEAMKVQALWDAKREPKPNPYR
jgi:hypothetical protein